jgi:hypothetical protein
MAQGKIELKVSAGDGTVAYVSLPGHPGRGTTGVTVKQIRLLDVYSNYKGPDLYFDFDKDDQLIGIEVLPGGVPYNL